MTRLNKIAGCMDVVNAFFDKVDKTADCWNWLGCRNNDGYGTITIGSRVRKAHRVSYLLHFGEIPEGQLICHRCDNPSCVNPFHLFAGTHSDNLKDARDKGRLPRSKLTTEDVSEIRKLLQAKIPQKEIAAIYFVDPSSISNIHTGKKWRAI